MNKRNLRTDFEATLGAMAAVEGDPGWLALQQIPSNGINVSAALEFLEEVADFSSADMKTTFFAVSGGKTNLWAWIVVGSGEVYFGRRRGDSSSELGITAALASAHGFEVVDWQPPK